MQLAVIDDLIRTAKKPLSTNTPDNKENKTLYLSGFIDCAFQNASVISEKRISLTI